MEKYFFFLISGQKKKISPSLLGHISRFLSHQFVNTASKNIASKEIPTVELHKKCMKLFVNMLSIIMCIAKYKIV